MSFSHDTLRFGIPVTAGTPPRSPRRVPHGQVVVYLIAGLLALLYAGAVIAWVGYGVQRDAPTATALLKGLVNAEARLSPHLLGPYEWAFTAALLLVGVLALAQRRAARGGALLLGWLLCALSTRELVGLLDGDHRADVLEPALGEWVLVTRVGGLLVGVLLTLLMLRADETRVALPSWAPAENELLGPREPYGVSRPRRLAYTLSGLLLLLHGAVATAWIGRRIHLQGLSVEDHLRRVLDPSAAGGPTTLTSGVDFYASAVALAFLLLGALTLARRPGARGAAVTLLAVELYLRLRFVVTLSSPSEAGERGTTWQDYTGDLEGWLYLSTVTFGVLLAVAVPLLLRKAARPVG